MDSEAAIITEAFKCAPPDAKGVWWKSHDMGELLGLSQGIVAKLKAPPANWVKSTTFATGKWFHTYQPDVQGGEKTRYYFIPSTAGDEPRSSMRGAVEREANNKARGDRTVEGIFRSSRKLRRSLDTSTLLPTPRPHRGPVGAYLGMWARLPPLLLVVLPSLLLRPRKPWAPPPPTTARWPLQLPELIFYGELWGIYGGLARPRVLPCSGVYGRLAVMLATCVFLLGALEAPPRSEFHAGSWCAGRGLC